MKTHTPRQQTSDWSRRKPSRMACAVAVVVLIGITLCSTFECLAQSGDDKNEIVEPQLLALRDPELLMPPPVRHLPESFLKLWIEAIASPEYELRRDVALSITQAHSEGYRDCSEAAGALIDSLKDESTPRSVLVEVARALAAIEARSSSAKLKELLKKGKGTHFELVAEPALARWGDAEMFALWQERLAVKDVSRHRRLLAIQAIAALPRTMTDNAKVQLSLASLIENSADKTVVLEASRTLGNVKREGLEPLAEQLSPSSGETSYPATLASVYLLLHHESKPSHGLLLRIITKSLSEPRHAPIVRAAWIRLLQQEVPTLATLAPQAIRHSDPEVRRNSIETLTKFPTDEGISLLGLALDDRHPDIRRAARQALLILSRNESLISSVRQTGLAAIARSSWREQEQAVVLLTILNQSDAADRMLQLLSSPRAEVAIAAAWGLRNLKLEKKLATLLTIAEQMDKQIDTGVALQPHDPVALAHIFEAIGQARYEPSIPMFKRWIPKNGPRFNYDEARTAAFWATGWLFEGSKDVALAQQLKVRFTDVVAPFPEVSESLTVRYAAAIALGRIGVAEVSPDLRRFALTKLGEPELAAAWSLERLTGEVVPPPDRGAISGTHWKLMPIGSRNSASADQQSR